MKKLLFLSFISVCICACQSGQKTTVNTKEDSIPQRDVKVVDGPGQIKFDTLYYDLGALEIDAPDETRDFVFVNQGSEPFRITKVEPSCKCLMVDYPKEAIAPGMASKITMTLKMDEILSGQFYRSAFVYTDASKDSTELVLMGIKKYK